MFEWLRSYNNQKHSDEMKGGAESTSDTIYLTITIIFVVCLFCCFSIYMLVVILSDLRVHDTDFWRKNIYDSYKY